MDRKDVFEYVKNNMEQYRNIFGKNPQKVRYFVIKTGMVCSVDAG